jgi:hypothetical protein
MHFVQDIRGINGMAMRAKHSGAVILGGGVVKHHIMNANLMRNGTDHCVYINTGQEVATKQSLPIVILAFDLRITCACLPFLTMFSSLTAATAAPARMRL